MVLADNLKMLRKNAKITQKQLTTLLSLNKTTIANIEGKGMEPSIDTLLKLSHYFNVSIDFLVGNNTKDEYKFNDNSNVSLGYTLSDIIDKKINPLWIRYINPSKDTNIKQDYIIAQNKLELYNPLMYHNDTERIYFDLINIPMNNYNNYYHFFAKYGFLGVTSSNDFSTYQYKRNIIDIIMLQQPLFYTFKQSCFTNYYENNKEHNNKFCSELENILENLKISIDFSGYYEELKRYMYYAADIVNIITLINDNKINNAYHIISSNIKDITFSLEYIKEKTKISATYKSLLSLIFLELLLDIQNGIIPHQCKICGKYYIGQLEPCPYCNKQ